MKRQKCETFNQQGYLICPGLFNKDEIAAIKAAARAHVLSDSNESGVKVFSAPNLPEAFKAAVCDRRIKVILEEIFNDQAVFLSVKPVFKSGNITFGTPWHQDHAYWGGCHKLSIWLALDEARPDNGCLKVIPGSHKKILDHDASQSSHGFGNRISEESLAGEEIMDVALAAGDALFFHDCLLHASHENSSGEDRWSFIPTYRPASEVDPDHTTGDLWAQPIRL